MKIFDISQKIFGCEIYPGDPLPKKELLNQISKGSICNLSVFTMCTHNGTHVDAPSHFLDKGKTIDEICLDRFVGEVCVVEHNGTIFLEDAINILEKANNILGDTVKRILIKGEALLSIEAAKIFVEAGIFLYGNESQTIGSESESAKVHRIMLGAEIVILEGIRLNKIKEGKYFLNAAPINLNNLDGAPCRAILIEI